MGGAAWVCGSGSAARDRCWDKQGLDTAWSESRELGEAGENFGQESFGKASGELGESFGFGKAWGDAGERLERVWESSGKLFGRRGESLGNTLWGRQSATRGPWSATTYHKQEPGTDDKVPSHLFSKHCVQAQKTYDLTKSGNHFREHLTFPWINPQPST